MRKVSSTEKFPFLDLLNRSLARATPDQQQDLRRDARAGIQYYVVHRAGARGQKALVPLIKAGHDRSSEDGEARPTEGPLGAGNRRQRFSPCAEQQDAQESVTEDMTALPHVEVPVLESRVAESKKIMEQRKEDAAGIV